MIDIRGVTAADAEAVVALWAEAGLIGSVDGRAEEVVRKLDRDPELFLLAEDSETGVLVGTVMGAYDGHRGYVKRMAVSEAARRQGLAGRLVAELERRFVELGVPRVHLHVLADNTSGRALWERLGYQHEDDVLFYGKDLTVDSTDRGRC